jgi:hypothetical protein
MLCRTGRSSWWGSEICWGSLLRGVLSVGKVGSYLLAGVEVQLLEDVGDVVMNRVLGEHQFGGDLAIGQSSPHKDRYFLLATGEAGRLFVGGGLLRLGR